MKRHLGNRKGAVSNKTVLGIVAIIAVAFIIVVAMMNNQSKTVVETVTTQAPTQANTQNTPNACPTTQVSTLTLDVQNPLNTSGAEGFDAEYTLLGADGDKITGTDTTAASISNLHCGVSYKLIIESADGASGDNSKIWSILEGLDTGAVLNNDGTVTFTPNGATYNLKVAVPQHATLEFKAYDNGDKGSMFDTGDASATDFETDGVVFTSITDNATGKTLSNDGDFVWVTYDVRAAQVDTEFCDNGCYIAVEAPVTEYDEPNTFKFNGVSLVDVKANGGLNEHEAKQLTNYEYVYAVKTATGEWATIARAISALEFYIEANSDASTNIEIDFLARGKVDSINGVDVITSSAQDNTAKTTVFAIQDTSLTIA